MNNGVTLVIEAPGGGTSPFPLRDDDAEPAGTNAADIDIPARRGLPADAVKPYA